MINMKSAVKEFTKGLKINIAVLCETVSRNVWNDTEADTFTGIPILGNSLNFRTKANVHVIECKFWYELDLIC
jgi:hypothetical protein